MYDPSVDAACEALQEAEVWLVCFVEVMRSKFRGHFVDSSIGKRRNMGTLSLGSSRNACHVPGGGAWSLLTREDYMEFKWIDCFEMHPTIVVSITKDKSSWYSLQPDLFSRRAIGMLLRDIKQVLKANAYEVAILGLGNSTVTLGWQPERRL